MCSSARAAANALRRLPPDRAEAYEQGVNGLRVLLLLYKTGGTALIAHGEAAFAALACMCSSARAAAYALR
eukprot:14146992-Heterocapsa_arctica.AAC.1